MYSSFVLCTHTTTCSHLLVHQNPELLLEGLDFDRDRTRVSNKNIVRRGYKTFVRLRKGFDGMEHSSEVKMRL